MNLSPLITPTKIFADIFRYLQYSRAPGADLSLLKIEWAQTVMKTLNVNIEVTGEVSSLRPLLFVGNHISYLDIPLLMAVAPNVSFVSKAEIAAWPLIGTGARTLDTILVKRESGDSRAAARLAIKEGLRDRKRIALYPAGTTRLDESRVWRRGPFEIAHELGVALQPFRLSYTPLRAAAYIDKDFFPVHLANLARLPKIEARIEFHPPVMVNDPAKEGYDWWQWAASRAPSPVLPANPVVTA